MRTRRNFATPDYQSVQKPEDLQRFASAHAKAAADSANSVIPDLVNLYQKNKNTGVTLSALGSVQAAQGATLTSVSSTQAAQGVTIVAQGSIISNHSNILAGNITPSNMKVDLVTLTWPAAQTESTVGFTHSRGVTAIGYVVINRNMWGDVVNPGGWTSNYVQFYWMGWNTPTPIGTPAALTAKIMIYYP